MPFLNTESIRLVLASQSPRRIELLKKIVTHFQVRASAVAEDDNTISDPWQLVVELSRRKAEKISQYFSNALIIGADSVVVLNGKILGKPKTPEESSDMLQYLSGRKHQVYTGFTVIKKPEQEYISDHEVTSVKFRELDSWEIDKYVSTNQSFDKAGAYGIQDDAAVFVESIEGCYYNVMGLPLTRLFLVLKKLIDH